MYRDWLLTCLFFILFFVVIISNKPLFILFLDSLVEKQNMESDLTIEPLPFIRFLKNGSTVESLRGNYVVPASLDPQNNVVSKDVVYSQEHSLSVRLFLPHKKSTELAADEKLPLLIYFHGGAFIMGSPFSPVSHNYLTEVVKASNCLAVSVQYRLAPEHPIPAAYEDSWSAM